MDAEAWLGALGHIARRYGMKVSAKSALNAVHWAQDLPFNEQLVLLAQRLGLRLEIRATLTLTPARLPLICHLKDGTIGVITQMDRQGRLEILLSGEETPTQIAAADLVSDIASFVIARPRRSLVDARVDDYIAPWRKNWLREAILPDLRPYMHVLLASFATSLLGLVGIIFSKQIYDRVIPAQSYNTLHVLFVGVVLALGFDFALRRARASIIDLLGKRADLRLSDRIFGRALRVKANARPASSGAFIAQLREIEPLRDTMTSTSVSLMADLPFFFLLLGVFWYIGGPLVIVPLGAVIVLILPGILVQGRLNRLINEGMREGAMRNSMLIEAVRGIEDIKNLQAEERFQQRWNHFNTVTAEVQRKQRDITSFLQTWGYVVQAGVFSVVIYVGTPMVIAGDMTTGTLVACSILSSRVIGPMAQFSQIFNRLQQARLSWRSLNEIMKMPVDHPEDETRVGLERVEGHWQFQSALYHHDKAQSLTALEIEKLEIKPGEKIAILGRSGAGKSTLLQALAGLIQPSQGEVRLEGVTLSQIDPADLRADLGYVSQEARLFHGTIRDNLILGAPLAQDKDIREALEIAGAWEFVSRNRAGLDYLLLEDGRGLSGGQRQALILARALLRKPNMLLLDEPTAAMDEASERAFITAMAQWAKPRGLIIATHRLRALDLVDRILLVEQGKITFDGDKTSFLRRSGKLASTTRAPMAPAPRRQAAPQT